MKYFLKPRYQYFILPLTVVFIAVIASINYTLWKENKKSIKVLISTFFLCVLFLLLIPIFIEAILNKSIEENFFFAIYFYIVSSIVSIYIIKEQEKYIENKNEGRI